MGAKLVLHIGGTLWAELGKVMRDHNLSAEDAAIRLLRLGAVAPELVTGTRLLMDAASAGDFAVMILAATELQVALDRYDAAMHPEGTPDA